MEAYKLNKSRLTFSLETQKLNYNINSCLNAPSVITRVTREMNVID